ncbi:MAG TPA: polysaccharide deacetylase family protein [Micromonosporaceae bacterium]|nr:polysaccharide deacetylase family protein [Micromonosporaceae bacterium]
MARTRFPALPAVGLLAVAIIMSGYALGRMTGSRAESVRSERSPEPSPVVSPPPHATRPAALPAPAPVLAIAPRPAPVLLANLRPVTGPAMPPLTPDLGGPFGSRRTTGTLEVALTFDDGPDPTYTPAVLALLRRFRVRATFCLIGRNVARFPQLVRQIYAEGHTLCNHSWDHDLRLGLRSPGYIRENLQRTNDAIRRAVPGSRVSYYRQPGGKWSRTVVNVAAALGMSSLHWRVDPQDWRKPGAGSISSTITSWTRPGAIILLHDGGGVRRGTVMALGSILPNLTRRFRLCAFPPGVDPPRWHGRELPVHVGQV